MSFVLRLTLKSKRAVGNLGSRFKLLFFGHRSLIKNITQTAVINFVFQRIFVQ